MRDGAVILGVCSLCQYLAFYTTLAVFLDHVNDLKSTDAHHDPLHGLMRITVCVLRTCVVLSTSNMLLVTTLLSDKPSRAIERCDLTPTRVPAPDNSDVYNRMCPSFKPETRHFWPECMHACVVYLSTRAC